MSPLVQGAAAGSPRPSFRARQVLSTDVMEWPEFRALAERLGINLGMATTVLTIQLAGDHPVVIDHQYEASDTTKQTMQPPMRQFNDRKGGLVLRCEYHSCGRQCLKDAGHPGECAFEVDLPSPKEPTT